MKTSNNPTIFKYPVNKFFLPKSLCNNLSIIAICNVQYCPNTCNVKSIIYMYTIYRHTVLSLSSDNYSLLSEPDEFEK